MSEQGASDGGHGHTVGLVGRGAELGRITAELRRASSGRGGVIVVEGEPGVGKTTLLDAAVALCIERGITVLKGGAKELERRLPFAALRSVNSVPQPSRDVLESAVRPLQALLRGEGPSVDSAFSQEFVVIEAALELINEWSVENPLAIVLDDAHWADTASLLVLRRIAEHTPELPVFVIMATRPLPTYEELPALFGQFDAIGAQRLALEPLSDSDVSQLVANLAGSPAGPGLRKVAARAGGNPLYVIELLAGLMEGGAVEVAASGLAELAEGTVDPDRIDLPRSVTDAIQRRLDSLPSELRHVLSIAAALGSLIEVVELATVLGTGVIDVWDSVDTAMQSGLLVRTGDGIAFRHDLIRQVFADQVPASTRAGLQQRAAQSLISMDGPVERIAEYLLASGGPHDRVSLSWLTKSAAQLTVRAPRLSVGLLERAIGAPGLGTDDERGLRLRQIRALLWCGLADRAERAARAVLREEPDVLDHELLWLLAQACMAQGHLRDSADLTDRVLQAPQLEVAKRGRYQGLSALLNFFLGNCDKAEHESISAIRSSEAWPDPVASGLGRYSLGFVRYFQGRIDEAANLGQWVIEQHQGVHASQRTQQFDPYTLRGQTLIELDRFAEAEEILNEATRFSERNGGAYLAVNLFATTRLHFFGGDWDKALACSARFSDAPDVFGYRAPCCSVEALIAIHRGTFVGGPDEVPELDNRTGSQGYLHLRPWAQALLLQAQGQQSAALASLRAMCSAVADTFTGATLHYVYPDMAQLAYVTGDRDAAAWVADAAVAKDALYSTPSRRATALLCRGLADARPDLLGEAAQWFNKAGRVLFEGQARENQAVLVAAAGEDVEARAALEAAIEIYSGLDAEWDIARAEARLRAHGIRRGRRGPRNRPKSGWEALTPTECKVAELVAQGRSNSEIGVQMFLSRRTVQTHISSILRKLNLESRVQVAVFIARQEQPGAGSALA